jgi:hypothetical protein
VTIRDEKQLLFLWLTQLNGIGTITQRKLLSAFQTPGDIRDAEEPILSAVAGIQKKQVRTILENRSLETAERILSECDRTGIDIITLSDRNTRRILRTFRICRYFFTAKEALEKCPDSRNRRCKKVYGGE